MNKTYKNFSVTVSTAGIDSIDGLDVFGSGKLEQLVKFNKNLAIYKFKNEAGRTSVCYTGLNRHNGKLINFGSAVPTKKILSTYTNFNGGYDYALHFTTVDINEIIKFK